VPLGLYRQQLC